MVKRKFIIGEEWLYFKLYCGIRTADDLLVELVLPLTELLFKRKLINRWFFIRYGDPDPHLRLRLKINDTDTLGGIIALFRERSMPFVRNNLIWKVQTDTYERELERYGSNTIELAEEIFSHDSELIVKTISLVDDEELYFLFTLRCISNFLSLFELDKTQRLKFYTEHAKAYKKEFKVERQTKFSLDKKYRNLKKNLDHVLDERHFSINYGPLADLLNQRDSQTVKIAKSIIKNKEAKTLEIPFSYLLSSYIHMFVNRAFRDRQRFYEMVSYDYLFRYHVAIYKRKESKNQSIK